MCVASNVLLAVAKEIVEKAKDTMPDLKEGEDLLEEWYEDGIYYRKTHYNGEYSKYMISLKNMYVEKFTA